MFCKEKSQLQAQVRELEHKVGLLEIQPKHVTPQIQPEQNGHLHKEIETLKAINSRHEIHILELESTLKDLSMQTQVQTQSVISED